jgi:hypothetical protein
METKENALSAFSEETLTEMGMENVEGGGILDGVANKSCPTNNCQGANCFAGCGVVAENN